MNTEVVNLGIQNNDDKILHCCLVYQLFVSGEWVWLWCFRLAPPSLASGGIVVLFSNDTQLCSKAIINGIKAFNSKV